MLIPWSTPRRGSLLLRERSTVLLLLLAACGASGPVSLLRTASEPAGERCPEGGTVLEAGLDDNGDGVLQDEEVDTSTVVCSGSTGEDGTAGSDGSEGSAASSTLITTSDEPAGDNCPEGGTRVDVGADDDGDGVLEPEEVDSTSYVCDGADGGPAARTLVAVSDEPAGDHCATGGERVDVGMDADGDGTLDAEEVGATSYVCDGSDAADGSGEASALVSTADEPAGDHCAEGGVAVSAGRDDDGDGVLDDDEVETVSYVCDGADGSVSGGWLDGATVVVGDYTVDNTIDVDLLDGVEQITGTLTISGDALGDLSIPDVQRVGALTVDGKGNKADALLLTSLSMPALTTVDGDLSLSHLELIDQRGLDTLSSVGGDVTLDYSGAVDFDMFAGLTTIGGSLTATAGDGVPSFGGFEALTSVGGAIDIVGSTAGSTELSGYGALRTVGELTLEGAAFTELTAFSKLETVTGELTLDSLSLTDLDGLASLRTLDGDVRLTDLTALEDVDGLSGLSSVGGDLRLYGLASLTDIDGLSGLSSVGGRLLVYSCGSLPDLTALSGLDSLGELEVSDDDLITDLAGLEGLSSVDSVGIDYNDRLTDITALSHITGALSGLTVYHNAILTNLDGLEGITGLEDLRVSENAALTDLGGLDGLSTITDDYIDFTDNTSLCVSKVNDLESRFPTSTATWDIRGDKDGC